MENNIEKRNSNIFAKNARIVAVFAVAMGATSGILGKAITASSMAIGFYRLTFALPFFAIPVLLHERETLKQLTLKQIAGCAVAGIFLFCHFFCWFNAVKMTKIASAVVLQSLHPLVVLVVTLIFFKSHVKGKAVLGICIALAGAALMAGLDYSAAGGSFAGDIFAIFTGVFYGLYFCVGNVMRKNIPAGVYVFMVFSFCWICFTLGMIFSGTPFTGYPVADYLWLLVMAMACQIGAHAVFNWVLGYVTPLFLSTWGNAEIVISTLLALVFFGEIPTLLQVAGGAITIVGLLIYNFNEN